MRLITLYIFSLISIFSSAQIGINTKKPSGIFHIDGKTDNSSPITANQANNDFIVTTEGNVGIGTINPTAKLSLNGTMSVTNVKTINASDVSYTPKLLMNDLKSGEIITVTSSSGNAFTLNYVTYVLQNCNGDWISSFNTQIKSTDYILAIVGYSFTAADGGAIGLAAGNTGGTFVSTTVTATVSNSKTWLLAADFNGGSPVNNKNGTWIINCLLINTAFAKQLLGVTTTLTGVTGSAPSAPSGL